MTSSSSILPIASVLAFGFLSGFVRAEDVPKVERGIWNIDSCGESRAAVALSRDFAILFETDPEKKAACFDGASQVVGRDRCSLAGRCADGLASTEGHDTLPGNAACCLCCDGRGPRLVFRLRPDC